MKDAPEIAPEIRGLLEEIVADPRSSLRLAPRRALLPWLESGDTLRTGDFLGTKAERHLIAAHRESLAQILYDAARIAYWKAPVLAHRPLGRDGRPYDPVEGEPAWRNRAMRGLRQTRADTDDVQLLAECISGVLPTHCLALARASLALIARETARFVMGSALSPVQPRASARIFERIALTTTVASTRDHAWGELGKTRCALGLLAHACEAYRRGGGFWRNAMSVFNLSLLSEDRKSALEASRVLDQLPHNHPSVLEGRQLLSQWVSTRPPPEIRRGTLQMRLIADVIGETTRSIGAVYE